MSKLLITQRADADLEEAWEYLAKHDEEAADRLLDNILKAARLHANFPLTGRPRDDLSPGLRSFVVRPYVIFFRSAHGAIEVLRVLHGSRDVDTIMRAEDPE